MTAAGPVRRECRTTNDRIRRLYSDEVKSQALNNTIKPASSES